MKKVKRMMFGGISGKGPSLQQVSKMPGGVNKTQSQMQAAGRAAARATQKPVPMPAKKPMAMNPALQSKIQAVGNKPMAGGPSAPVNAGKLAQVKSMVTGRSAPTTQRGLGSAMGAKNTGIGNAMARQTLGKVGASPVGARMGMMKKGGSVMNGVAKKGKTKGRMI
jgi:hypothetical protein